VREEDAKRIGGRRGGDDRLNRYTNEKRQTRGVGRTNEGRGGGKAVTYVEGIGLPNTLVVG